MSLPIPRKALHLAGGAAAGLLALLLIVATVSWLVSQCLSDIRKSASDPTPAHAAR